MNPDMREMLMRSGPLRGACCCEGGAGGCRGKESCGMPVAQGKLLGNGVEDRVEVHEIDASELPVMLSTSFDRAMIPTPYGMDGMLYRLAPLVRQGGMIHFYTFKKRHQIPGLAREFAQEGYDVVTTRRCGNVAPSVSRWVFDLCLQ
jgi:tRNA G37 N-methylase Trm5